MRNPKKTLLIIRIIVITLFMMPLTTLTQPAHAQSSRSIHVNPIENLRPDFIMGVDVSMLKQIEDSGGKFYQDGEEKDALAIFQDHGVNWIRLRIWNDPTHRGGDPRGGGHKDNGNTQQPT
jgi:arabinogalactan endo-1,4-beta-galactosidase